MEGRTLLKIQATENGASIRTISRDYHSPVRFYVPNEIWKELEEKRYIVTSDTGTFLKMELYKMAEGKQTIRFVFYWLNCDIYNTLMGQKEDVEVSYERFQACLEKSRICGGENQKVLSMKPAGKPRLEFKSRYNLKRVAGKKVVRKKLGKFLARNFNWYQTQKILVTDDFEPYSFFFEELRASGNGICGGIILHGRENLSTAYYGIHT